MDFWKNISLLQDSSTAVVTTMWYSINPTDAYQNRLNKEEFNACWQEFENTIVNKLKQLTIPEKMQNLLINMAQPIGREIKKWLEYHKFLQLSDINLSDTLVWRSCGIIDYRATAQKTTSNKKLSSLHRFQLACINCLDKVIYQLWPEVRPNFFNEDRVCMNYIRTEIIMFWLYHLENKIKDVMEEMGHNPSHHQFMETNAWNAIMNNNLVAAQYFIEQLEPQVANKVIKRSANYLVTKRVDCDTDLLIYLVFNLSETDRNILFVAQSDTILQHFLNWPLHNLFLENTHRLSKSLSAIGYYDILEEIIRKASVFYHGQIYREIFVEYWEKASLSHKCYVINKCINGAFLSRLFRISKTDEFIERIIKYSTVEQRKQMLLEFKGMQTIDFLVSQMRWNSLIMFIKTCISNETDINELRETYKEHVSKKSCSYLIISDTDIKNFNDILDNIDQLDNIDLDNIDIY